MRYVHSGSFTTAGSCASCFGGGKKKWSCCQSRDADLMWCGFVEGCAVVKKAGVEVDNNGLVVVLKGWVNEMKVVGVEKACWCCKHT